MFPEMPDRPLSADERAKIFKALADPRRVDMVDLLARGGAMCGTNIAESLGMSLALVCHHWEVLVDAGIVKKERVGQLRVCTVDLDRIRAATGGWGPNRSRPAAPARTRSRPPRARAKDLSRKRSTRENA